MDKLLFLALGYAFAVFVGHFLIVWVVGRLWRSIGLLAESRSAVRPGWWLPKAVGVLERALYVAAFLTEAYGFIGVWLAMKVAGRWHARTEGIEQPDGVFVRPHSIFLVFLIGNGLSIAYGAVGAHIIRNSADHLVQSLLAVGGLLTLCFVIVGIALYYKEEFKRDISIQPERCNTKGKSESESGSDSETPERPK